MTNEVMNQKDLSNQAFDFFVMRQDELQKRLPSGVSIEKFMTNLRSAFLHNPDLSTADLKSLYKAISKACRTGLSLDPSDQEAAIVIYKGSATFLQMYKGMRKLALQSGQILVCKSAAVYSNDECEIQDGETCSVHHKINLKDRGELIGFYSYVKLVNGESTVRYMTAKDVEAIRDESANYKYAKDRGNSIWGKHFVAMGMKTVFKAHCNWLPIESEHLRLLNTSDDSFVPVMEDKEESPAIEASSAPIIEPVKAIPRKRKAPIELGQAIEEQEQKPKETVTVQTLASEVEDMLSEIDADIMNEEDLF